jgi:hypothetical protein
MKLTRRDLVFGTAVASVIGLMPLRLFGQPAAVIRKRMETLINGL